MLGTSDAWSTSHVSKQTIKPAYYIVDCWISKAHRTTIPRVYGIANDLKFYLHATVNLSKDSYLMLISFSIFSTVGPFFNIFIS